MAVNTPLLPNLLVAEATPENRDRGIYIDEPMTTLSVANYNNFYEFTTDKERVAVVAAKFVAQPWTVTVERDGPQTKGIRYRRSVWAWPAGRADLPNAVRGRVVHGHPVGRHPVGPASGPGRTNGRGEVRGLSESARSRAMPGQKRSVLQWPYIEGLRIDEAMHPLTLLAVGLYGRELPAQNGAPIRLVVPWKYGFKGIKSIVKITLLSDRPPTTWNLAAPSEYGFYSNVNPNVAHPRWSQATERRMARQAAGRLSCSTDTPNRSPTFTEA